MITPPRRLPLSSAALASPPALRPSCPARAGLVAGSLALVALLIAGVRVGFAASSTLSLIYAARLAIEATALLWPLRRRELDPRLRFALGVLGGTSVVSAAMELLHAAAIASGPTPATETLANAYSVVAYGAFLTGVWLMPMVPFRRGEWPTFALDVTISAGGFAAILGWLDVIPAVRLGADQWTENLSLLASLCAVLCLIGLNLLTLRGRAIPSRRAFWLLLAGIGSYLPVTLFVALEDGSPSSRLLSEAAYFLGVIPTLAASWAMCRDPIPAVDHDGPTAGFRSFNPFALAMPVAVGVALLHAIEVGHAATVRSLAVTAVLITALLVVRLALTIREQNRRAREQAQQEVHAEVERLESLTRVAAGVAHAFNNSLTVVLGECDLGLSTRPGPTASRAFAQIRRAGERSAALTRHLLWYTGRQHRCEVPLETRAWLRALEPDLRLTAGSGILLELDPGAAECWVLGDEAQLREVLLELVRNAARAMEGRGTVRVANTERVFESEPPAGLRDPLRRGRYACLAVRDSGRGMPPDVLAHVFDPFFTSRPRDPSAGLGLSLAHGVVRAHGGRIEVDSAPGRGSEFRVLVPCAPVPAARR